MDAFYIINIKTKEKILFKIFNEEKQSEEILKIFLSNFDKKISYNNDNTTYIIIKDTYCLFFPVIFQTEEVNQPYNLIYLILTPYANIYLPSYTKIFKSINNILYSGMKDIPNLELLYDNMVSIILMLEHYFVEGIPILNEPKILSSLVTPYHIGDKIGEKIIGFAKKYDSSSLKNYINNLQLNSQTYLYSNNDEISDYQPEIYFDYIDYIYLFYDNKFNLLRNKTYSEINISSHIQSNIELNILLNIPYKMLNFSLDESVITKRKELIKNKNIDCICKHGMYSLMNMIPILENSFIKLPFKISTQKNISNNVVSISIKIFSEKIQDNAYDITDTKIILNFNRNNSESINNINITPSIGEFYFNEEKNEATWKIDSFYSDNFEAILKGNLKYESEEHINNFNCVVIMSCNIEKYSISGGKLLKVNCNDNRINKFYKNKTIIRGLEMIL